jgi:hypothetical protein
LGEEYDVKGQDMAAKITYSEVEGLLAMHVPGATMSHNNNPGSVSGNQSDQAIADASDLVHRLTNLVEAFGNLGGPHPATKCGVRRS